MRMLLITAAFVALAGPVFAKPTPGTGTPLLQPTAEQGEAAIWATRFLTRFHYQPTPLDDAMSSKILDGYIEALDGDRLFFLQADITRFEAYRDRLDDAIVELGGEGMMRVRLRAGKRCGGNKQNDQIALHIVVPPCQNQESMLAERPSSRS